MRLTIDSQELRSLAEKSAGFDLVEVVVLEANAAMLTARRPGSRNQWFATANVEATSTGPVEVFAHQLRAAAAVCGPGELLLDHSSMFDDPTLRVIGPNGRAELVTATAQRRRDEDAA